MRQILEDFYYGNFSPNEMPMKSNKECRKLCGVLEEIENKLKAELSEPQKQLFEKYLKYSDEITSLSEKDIFINGFSLGVKMIIACYNTEYLFERPDLERR